MKILQNLAGVLIIIGYIIPLVFSLLNVLGVAYNGRSQLPALFLYPLIFNVGDLFIVIAFIFLYKLSSFKIVRQASLIFIIMKSCMFMSNIGQILLTFAYHENMIAYSVFYPMAEMCTIIRLISLLLLIFSLSLYTHKIENKTDLTWLHVIMLSSVFEYINSTYCITSNILEVNSFELFNINDVDIEWMNLVENVK